jgi:hypothetical protein
LIAAQAEHSYVDIRVWYSDFKFAEGRQEFLSSSNFKIKF